jgi:hypothetical protein
MVLESILQEILVVWVVGEVGARNVVVVVVGSVCGVVRRGVDQGEVGPHGSGWVPLGVCGRRWTVDLVLIWCVGIPFLQRPGRGIC